MAYAYLTVLAKDLYNHKTTPRWNFVLYARSKRHDYRWMSGLSVG
jgi:hypothetical protein